MSRENWLAASAALMVLVLVGVFASDARSRQVSANTPLPIEIAAEPALLPASGADDTESTTTATKLETKQTAAVVMAPAPSNELALALGSLRDALVNIICRTDDEKQTISASGVIIDSRGLILTVAHAGQFFLLADAGKASCVIRTGNPAKTAYFADPVYVSSTWIQNNPDTLVTQAPTGTGENDFAVLAITATATKESLPSAFPYVPLSGSDPRTNDDIAIGSYPAQMLTGKQIISTLYPTLVFAKVVDRYTFVKDTVDLLSLGGSTAAQEGSSGGGVVNAHGELIGTITTSSVKGTLLSRTLRAITVGHVRRSFLADTGRDFDSFLQSDTPSALAADYVKKAKSLSSLIETGD